MSLAVLRLAPRSACGAPPEIRQSGLPKPGRPPRATTAPPSLAAENSLTRPPLTELNYVRNALLG